MKREIVTYPLTKAQVASELDYFVDHFRTSGSSECEVLFGPAWGNDYYPEGGPWEPVRLPLTALAEETRRAGTLGWGGLGDNNLFVTVPGVAPTFFFCHEADLHLCFDEPDEVTEHFYQRWKALGFRPREWTKNADRSKGELLRSD